MATGYLLTHCVAGQGDVARKDSRCSCTGSIRLIDDSLFRLFAAFNAYFALVQF